MDSLRKGRRVLTGARYRLFKCGVAALVFSLLVLAYAEPALTGKGEQKTFVEKIVIDETRFDGLTSAFCGLPVELHEQAHLNSVVVSPRDEHFRFTLSGPTTYTLTNLDTGVRVEALNTVSFHDAFRTGAQSSRSVFWSAGLNYRVKTPEGTFTSAGSSALGVQVTFDEGTEVPSIDVFGHLFTPHFLHFYPMVCVFLGAVDSDNDFLPDDQGIRTEAAFGSDPQRADTDGDGYLDGIEVANETSPTDPSSHPAQAIGHVDKDGDLLADGEELLFIGTDPRNPDTDGDGYLDGPEWGIYGTDPTDPESHP